MPALARFLQYVRKDDTPDNPDACWVWVGSRTSRGVGNFGMEGKTVLAHRAAALLFGMPIQTWHCAVRSCGNTLCVRPQHIELLTKSQVGTRVAQIPPSPGLVAVWVSSKTKKGKVKKWVTPIKARNLRRKQRKGTYCTVCDTFIRSKANGKKYCCLQCRRVAHAKLKEKRPCERCGEPIPWEPNKSFKRKFCSYECRCAAQGEHLSKVSPFRNGTRGSDRYH